MSVTEALYQLRLILNRSGTEGAHIECLDTIHAAMESIKSEVESVRRDRDNANRDSLDYKKAYENEYAMHKDTKAELEQWHQRAIAAEQEAFELKSSQQICVGAAGVGDFSELCGWIDAKKSELAKAQAQAKIDNEGNRDWINSLCEQLCKMEDALGFKNDCYDKKGQWVPTIGPWLERVRDLLAAEGEVGDLKEELAKIRAELDSWRHPKGPKKERI